MRARDRLLIVFNSHFMQTNTTDNYLILPHVARISSKSMILYMIMTLITGIIFLTVIAFQSNNIQWRMIVLAPTFLIYQEAVNLCYWQTRSRSNCLAQTSGSCFLKVFLVIVLLLFSINHIIAQMICIFRRKVQSIHMIHCVYLTLLRNNSFQFLFDEPLGTDFYFTIYRSRN